MTIPLPNLDDRSYEALITEAQTLIPALYPAWTDFNPSDPGITLVELLAFLVEMVLYRVNEIPDNNVLGYLKLLNGPGWALSGENLETAVQQSITTLRQRYRAVTTADYEQLALTHWPQQVQRAFCLSGRNLSPNGPGLTQPAPGQVSLIIVPPTADPTDHTPTPDMTLCQAVWQFLKDRRLLAVRHHVVAPTYLPVAVKADLYLHRDTRPEDALNQARAALLTHFDPLQGGPDQRGWPFGRHIFASELYALLARLASVNYISNVQLTLPTGVTVTDEVPLDDYQLVNIDATGLRAITADGHIYCFAEQGIQIRDQEASNNAQ